MVRADSYKAYPAKAWNDFLVSFTYLVCTPGSIIMKKKISPEHNHGFIFLVLSEVEEAPS